MAPSRQSHKNPAHPWALFVVGNARSGTTILGRCLNLSSRVCLLREAHLHEHHRTRDFARFFNVERRAVLGSHPSKSTIIPETFRGGSAFQVLSRMARHYRYVGDKVAFGPWNDRGSQPPQQAFYAFQGKHFFDAWHFLTLRQASESVWSMQTMFPQHRVPALLRCWLETVRVALDVYLSFPNVRVLFWERIDAPTLAHLGDLLGVTLPSTRGVFDRRRSRSRLAPEELPAALESSRRLLVMCDLLYEDLREAFSPRTLTFCRRVEPERMLGALRDRAGELLDVVRDFEQVGEDLALASGERFIPGPAAGAQMAEHLGRYALAAPLVKGRRVLDLGCGTGYGADLLARAGARRVLGVDLSPETIAFARAHYGGPGRDFEVADATALDAAKGPFDVIVMFEVLEHLECQAEVLAQAAALLARNGVLLVSTPNRDEHPGERFNRFHTRELTRRELRALTSPHFARVDLYAFGQASGAWVAPEPWQARGRARVAPTMFDDQVLPEPPFLIAVCSKGRPAPAIPPTFLPFSLERTVNAGLLREREVSRARSLAVELLSAYASDPNAFWQRVRALDELGLVALEGAVRTCIEQGQHAVVLDLLRALCEKQPARPAWSFLLAVCLHHIGRAAWAREARALYDRAEALGYDEFWVRLHRGSLALVSDDPERATEDLSRAHALQPSHAWAGNALAEARRRLANAHRSAGRHD